MNTKARGDLRTPRVVEGFIDFCIYQLRYRFKCKKKVDSTLGIFDCIDLTTKFSLLNYLQE